MFLIVVTTGELIFGNGMKVVVVEIMLVNSLCTIVTASGMQLVCMLVKEEMDAVFLRRRLA